MLSAEILTSMLTLKVNMESQSQNTAILTPSCWINLDATPTSAFQPIRLLEPGCWYKFTYLMTNGVDPDQLASGSTLFVKAGYIRGQQDQG